jgi:hypothetical protein
LNVTGRGLGTNLYRLGLPEKTIQAILRHANVLTTNTYYIKSAADDFRNATAKLERLVTRDGQVEFSQSDNNEGRNLNCRTPVNALFTFGWMWWRRLGSNP